MVIFWKKSDLENVRILVGGAGVLTVSFSYLGQTNNLLDNVENVMVRGMPDLQNPAVVCPKIEWLPNLVFLDFLNILKFSVN